MPFFSRRVGLSNQGEPIDIIAGAKVTGRAGPFNIGLLDVVTDAYTRMPEGGARTRVKTQNLSVARITANVLEESNVGAVFTHGDPNSNDQNLLYGLDFNYRNSNIRPGRTLIARAWGQGTDTEHRSGDDWAWGTRLQYPNDRVNWQLIAEEVRKNFFPGLGFTNRIGIRNYFGSFRYRIRPARHLRTLDTEVSGSSLRAPTIRCRARASSLIHSSSPMRSGTSSNFTISGSHERLLADFTISEGVLVPKDSYNWNRYEVTASSSDGRPLSVTMTVGWGGFFGGSRLDLLPSVLWRPSKHLLLSVAYERNDVDLPGGDFAVDIASVRADLQFTPEISWTTLAQYDNASDQIGNQQPLPLDHRARKRTLSRAQPGLRSPTAKSSAVPSNPASSWAGPFASKWWRHP